MTGREGRGKEKREGRRKKRKEEQALREPNAEKHGFGKENVLVLQFTAGILGSVSHGHTILLSPPFGLQMTILRTKVTCFSRFLPSLFYHSLVKANHHWRVYGSATVFNPLLTLFLQLR